MNIAVLVSGGGTNFQALLDTYAAEGLGGGEIVLCLSSSPDAYALERARRFNVPTEVVDRKKYSDRESYTLAVMQTLESYNVELIVLSGFMCIMGESFCKRYENRIINVHPALIPSFCGEGYYGLKVHQAALDYGVKVTGATVHFVTAETDGGPVILQKAVDIEQDDTPETLQRRVMEQAEWKILPAAVRLFCEGRLAVEGRKVIIKE
ncbi:MAG: phosphoribosylglycinamide formyltransferase [Clostridia bacterium]|nr:phosphoribosylglycinamide formyltransferase [Clostridia bacterium]